MSQPAPTPTNFLRQIVEADLAAGRHQAVATRFPPEPNGYLHIGHAKSICLNFGLARDFGGTCNLRFDDTNPEKESQEYIDAIQRDVRWLGFTWAGEVRYASGYFAQLHAWAVELIEKGLAYVDSQSAEDMRRGRGTLTEPGKNSPFRARSVAENLDLFARMRAGEFDEGAHVLRAKIDMAAPNMVMRDPAIYRIRKAHHHQTGDAWCIYPMYDFAHPLSDAIEQITHSICTLEFEEHRPLYDWLVANVSVPAVPRQYEFARLNLNYTVTSKRKLKQLVDEGHVSGWDDARMPTIAGLRRRGYTPASIRHFCDLIGVTRSDGVVDMSMLEFAIRDDLDKSAPRAMCVLRPLKVTITSWAEGQVQELTIPRHPKDEALGSRVIPMTREIFIDREDFSEQPPAGWKRLEPGQEVRLRGSYVIRCDEVVKDAAGNIVELKCSHDANTLGKNPEGRKVKGVIHWVPANESVLCEVRLYERLFTDPTPDGHDDRDFLSFINPQSLTVVPGARVEPALRDVQPEERFQFEREGYFCADLRDTKPGAPVFNLTVGLRDSFGK
jgi:glutaminyl-tRNA synthetase